MMIAAGFPCHLIFSPLIKYSEAGEPLMILLPIFDFFSSANKPPHLLSDIRNQYADILLLL